MPKIFDFVTFAREHSIPILHEGHKHSRPNWVQTICPFCTGNPGWHLGYRLDSGHFHCWRCGSHPNVEVVQKVLQCGWMEARRIAYNMRSRVQPQEVKEQDRVDHVDLPIPNFPLNSVLLPQHQKYLKERDFDPFLLAQIWRLRCTNHETPGFKHRILAPVYYQGKLVTYQGRDITGKSLSKYKNCPKEKSILTLHETLYGIDQVPGDAVVVVEGITDVWRLGPGAVSTFGVDWSRQQAMLLRPFNRRYILFDQDDAGQEEAKKLAKLLAGFDGTTEVIEITLDNGSGFPSPFLKDPADHSQMWADLLMDYLKVR